MCYGSTLEIFFSFSAVIALRRENLKTIDVSFWRLKSVPALYNGHNRGIQMKQKLRHLWWFQMEKNFVLFVINIKIFQSYKVRFDCISLHLLVGEGLISKQREAISAFPDNSKHQQKHLGKIQPCPWLLLCEWRQDDISPGPRYSDMRCY